LNGEIEAAKQRRKNHRRITKKLKDKKLLEAARLIRDHCKKRYCRNCIFSINDEYDSCKFYRNGYGSPPCNWDLPRRARK